MNAQIKKGILEMCIFWIVKESESIYGYDLIKKVGEYFKEVNEINNTSTFVLSEKNLTTLSNDNCPPLLVKA